MDKVQKPSINELPCSKEPTFKPGLEPEEFSARLHILLFKIHFIIILASMLDLSLGPFLLYFPTKILCSFLVLVCVLYVLSLTPSLI
jgi:hypothetical protein